MIPLVISIAVVVMVWWRRERNAMLDREFSYLAALGVEGINADVNGVG